MSRLTRFQGGPLDGEERIVDGIMYTPDGIAMYMKHEKYGPFVYCDPEPTIERIPWWARPAEPGATAVDSKEQQTCRESEKT